TKNLVLASWPIALFTYSLPPAVLCRKLRCPLPGAREPLLDRRAQTVGGIFSEHGAVDKEGRRGFDTVHLPVFDIAANQGVVFARVELGIEPLSIQSHLRRILLQRIRVERGLVLEQEIDVLPELALRFRGF